ncbi:MAG: copper amine oxidase N-terminal domain-containing protein [Peptococcaceae bacterium]|nr:copper amine oxidase N-terminal domain-containing protein [Peptococcaceae bacterium]
MGKKLRRVILSGLAVLVVWCLTALSSGDTGRAVPTVKAAMADEVDEAIRILEELIATDGRDADPEKYKKLGRLLEGKEKRINIYINGRRPVYQDVLPGIENGRILVPLRVIAEGFGAEVLWDAEKYTATVKKDDLTIELYTGEKTACVNGCPVALDVPARIVKNRMVIPLRFVAEWLEADIQWVPEGQVVIVSYNPLAAGRTLSDADFTVKSRRGDVKLGDWDSDLNLEKILGKPLAETTEQLGAGADTFAGSYVRRQVYEGLELRLMSPKGNGKTFFIDRIHITGDEYQTARNIKVGDSLEKMLDAYYRLPPAPISGFGSDIQHYRYHDKGVNSILFEIKSGIIKSITLEIEHP